MTRSGALAADESTITTLANIFKKTKQFKSETKFENKVAPFAHEWTYEALAYDALPIEAPGGVVR